MPEINYKELKNYLKDHGKEPFAPVCLIYGEDLLYKTAFEELLDVMVPASTRSFNYEPVDGASENIQRAIRQVNTYSLLSGTKVVAICDSRIFYSKQDDNKLLEKAKEAYDKNDIKKCAKYFMSLLELLELTFDDVGRSNRSKTLKYDAGSLGDDKWLDKVIGYCEDNGLSVSAGKDNAGALQEAIEKGFPDGNHLIITTDMIDKRRTLFKTIKKHGVIVDCSVPRGERRADRAAQEVVLKERMNAILAKSEKTMESGAYSAIVEMTGFDLRTFSDNIEKLVNYAGDRKQITINDVEFILKRTKKDPIYELTNAISDRNVERALFFLDSLISGDLHPLQILAAITNQIRKLLLVKGFTESSYGAIWNAGVVYSHFQSSIMPAICKYDGLLLNQLEDWENMLSKDVDADNEIRKKRKAKSKQKKSKIATDLLIAKNPNNPYPVYQMLKNAERFTKDDLVTAVECLSKADRQLKSTPPNCHKLILEKVIFHICKQKG